jgi:hypothetical protein
MCLHSAFLYINDTQITQYVKQTHIFSVYLSMLDFQNINNPILAYAEPGIDSTIL